MFYPWAFSNVCTGEMTGIRDRLAEFMTFDTEVLAISTDPTYSLRVVRRRRRAELPAAQRLLAARRGGAGLRRVRRRARGRPAVVVRRRQGAGSCAGRCTTQLPDGRDLDEHLARLHHLD